MLLPHRNRTGLCAGLLFVGLFGLGVAPAPAQKENTATKPEPRDENWKKRHEGFVAIAKKGDVDVVFLGDSITDGWRGKGGADVWKERFEPLKAANFGIGGDRTQHVLWRIQNGELDGIKPKAAVVMIGTNNMGSNTAEEIAAGVKAIVDEIHKRQPQAKILLLAIFPRAGVPTKDRDKIEAKELNMKVIETNKLLAKLDDGKTVRYLDISQSFLEKDGSLSKETMYDFLHLTSKGYKAWADAIQKPLEELLKK